MMARKDYIAIAGILRDIPDCRVRHDVTENFVRVLRDDNPRFDAKRFLVAVESDKK